MAVDVSRRDPSKSQSMVYLHVLIQQIYEATSITFAGERAGCDSQQLYPWGT